MALPPDRAPPPPDQIEILHFEDNPSDRVLVRAELAGELGLRLQVSQAETLAEGLARLLTQRFDLVLLDLHLPDSDGLATFEQVHRAAPSLPVIVLTGSYDPAVASEILRQGAQDCLQKGHLAQRELAKTIRHAIERQRFAAHLRAEQALTASLLDTVPDHIYFKDRESRFVRVNHTMARHFGLTDPAHAIGKTDFDFFSAEHARKAHADEQRLLHSGESLVGLEEKETWPDGRITWVSTTKVALRDPAGHITGLVGISRDITEPKKTEDAIRISERRFRALIESSSDAIAVIDAENNILYHSPAVARVEGYTAEELAGHNGLELTHPDDIPTIKAFVAELLAHPGHPIPVLWRRRHKDGRWLWLEGVATNLLHDPAVGGIVTNYRDVTERKLAEARIREQATLLDQASDAIIVRDLNDVIRFWNLGAERVYGWTAAEVLGRNLTNRLMSDPAAHRVASESLRRYDEWSGELHQVRKDGRDIVVECRWTLLRNERGEPQSILSINTDITERKKLESQFLRAQRMESIGTLAGGIAHDLNNVLTPILMAIGVIRLSAVERESVRMLDLMEASANRGASLVRQVLAFARGVEGQRIPLQPAHIAQEIRQIVHDTFPRTIHFELQAPRDLWTVTGDPTQLHQIIVNLCVNARDAMPNGGSLTLGLENVLLDETFTAMNPESKAGPHVIIKVADTGSGIPPAIRERIFEPFFTTKEVGKGTGLGLSTVVAIARSHGGFVNLYSDMGKGSTFKVYLPAQVAPAATPSAELAPSGIARGQGELVLMVDDEDIIRSIAQKTLEHFGYHVLLASNGAEAVALYAQHQRQIAVVITDMSMPVMGGAATILALRAINPLVKIIGSSGLSNANVNAQAADAGVVRFIAKPYLAEELLKALHEVIATPATPPA
jgi:PAS domain S-box-containing protein